jgi:hypothetical protein
MQAQNNITDKKKQQQNKESGITKMDFVLEVMYLCVRGHVFVC